MKMKFFLLNFSVLKTGYLVFIQVRHLIVSDKWNLECHILEIKD